MTNFWHRNCRPTGHSRFIRLLALTGYLTFAPFALAANDERGSVVNGISQPSLTIGVGHAMLLLPEVEFTHLSEQFADDTLFKFENHDGEVDGVRIDMALDFLRLPLGNWSETVGIKGYYASLESSSRLICDEGPASTNCTYGPLFLDDPLFEDKKDSNEDMLQTTDRDVEYWGVALEMRFHTRGDDQQIPPLALKAGLAFKAIDQQIDIHGEDIEITDDVFNYNEDLQTDYWGGYLGLQKIWGLGAGFSLLLDAEAGLYYADTFYRGRLVATGLIPEDFSNEQLSLDDQQVAAIGALRLEGRKVLGPLIASLYGEAELYSYVPKMNYKDTEIDFFPVTGFTPVTKIERDSAIAYSLGGRLSLPLGSTR